MNLIDKYLGEDKEYNFPVIQAKMKTFQNVKTFKIFMDTVLDAPGFQKLKTPEQIKIRKMFQDRVKEKFVKLE